MIKAVIFDLDGTLLDTGKGVVKSVKYTIQQMKLPSLSQSELETFVGPPIKNKLQKTFDLTEEQAVEGMNIFRNHYGKEDIYIAEPYAAIEDLLGMLKRDGYKLGVATYKREDQAIKLLEKMQIADFFDVIHGADSEGKMSKADVINKSLLDLDCDPQEAVMVGDSDNDAIGAETAGMHFLGVTYGYGFKSEVDVAKHVNIGSVADCLSVRSHINTFNESKMLNMC